MTFPFAIRHWTFAVLMAVPFGTSATTAAAPPPVTITGGADPAGYIYTWTVTSKRTSPIVHVEFPHYHGTLFFAPEDWFVECTFLVNVGVEDRPGVCTARNKLFAEAPARPARNDVAPRSRPVSGKGNLDFRMQVVLKGTRRGQGKVLVRFADGSEVYVAGVELPQRETAGDKYVPLIGLGLIFVVWVIARSWGRAKRQTP